VTDSFPRQQARTRRFTLGVPRDVQVSADGERIAFLRSPSGEDPATALWVRDRSGGTERLVVGAGDARLLLEGPGEETAQERSRRERRREQASGIVAYSVDADLRRAAFALGGQAWVVELDGDQLWKVPAAGGGVFDPRLDPTGRHVAWCAGRTLRCAEVGSTESTCLAEDDAAEVCWGQAEFVAAEEMGRDRGYWWAPDGAGLLAARVDVSAVALWWISDPAHPEVAPHPLRYPAAGTDDARVDLWYLGLDGQRRQVEWDVDTYPYLVDVHWSAAGRPLLAVERRDHRRAALLEVDPGTGGSVEIAAVSDSAWVSIPHGLPLRCADGAVVWVELSDDTVRLSVEGEPVTPAGLQVRRALPDGEGVLLSASREPSEVGAWRWSRRSGLEEVVSGGVVTDLAAGGGTVVLGHRRLERDGTEVTVLGPAGPVGSLASHAARPLLTPRVRIEVLGQRGLRTAVVYPAGHVAGTRLPVLLAPYGGPGAQKVLADRNAWLEAQWRADQGYAVVVADGRGTPGRGPAWERAVHGDLAGPALADQVDALHAAAEAHPDLDLSRVGIYGWSFGGFLAALAVLRRPDVFHAAVAGAPVTDWRLYDTYYTERFLGSPVDQPEVYERSSLLADAARLARPLLLVHGLADDNVAVAHTLRLSQRLSESGRQHCVLPLVGITHMAADEEVAERLLELQTRFLTAALALRA